MNCKQKIGDGRVQKRLLLKVPGSKRGKIEALSQESNQEDLQN